MMDIRDSVRIDASGKDGKHGKQENSCRNFIASAHCPGSHGNHATHPTPGENGRHLQVHVSYSDSRPQEVQIHSSNILAGHDWRIQSPQSAFLDTHGGHGGNGGNGENGQQGGRGRNGISATKVSDATDGGQGENGGDGGSGTSGAEGGNGGDISISVHENDLDCLSCIMWETSGGSGGQPGTHGRPGEGGPGGCGGAGYTETNDDLKVERRGGFIGYSGSRGACLYTSLTEGKSGKPGKVTISVTQEVSGVKTYSQPYKLRVYSYNVVDENNDGIFEPGESVVIKNLVLENQGEMPSPKHNRITVSIVDDKLWLHPIQSLELPQNILPGQRIEVEGELVAHIRSENPGRLPGVKLLHKGLQVRLKATFQRLDRDVPDFHTETGHIVDIDIRYPVELEAPVFLNCVTKGETVKISWNMKNVSKKPYDLTDVIRRRFTTCLEDPSRVFVTSTDQNRLLVSAEHTILQPGELIRIERQFFVSDNVSEYGEYLLQLQLLRSSSMPNAKDPALPESIITHGFRLQISGLYEYKESSQFLLVANSATPSQIIHNVQQYIQDILHLEANIYNISLNGTFVDSQTSQNVLDQHSAKSIIFFANEFLYYQGGKRAVWDLLDPWHICRLVKEGTNFLFLHGSRPQSLKSWASMVGFSTPFNMSFIEYININRLLEELNNSEPGAERPDENEICYQFPHSPSRWPSWNFWPFRQTEEESLFQEAKAVADQLTATYPWRRFLSFANIHHGLDSTMKQTRIRIIEGIPLIANIQASNLSLKKDRISGHHAYMILSALPFRDRVHMFWNMASQPEKGVISTLTLSIEAKIISEIRRYYESAPWDKRHIYQQPLSALLPHLSLLTTIKKRSDLLPTSDSSDYVIKVFATILSVLTPDNMVEWLGSSVFPSQQLKIQIRAKIEASIAKALGNVYSPAVAHEMLVDIQKQAKVISGDSGWTWLPSRVGKTLENSFFETIGVSSMAVIDLAMGDMVKKEGSVAWSEEELSSWRTRYKERMRMIEVDHVMARDTLKWYSLSGRGKMICSGLVKDQDDGKEK